MQDMDDRKMIYVLHENEAWVRPLRAALEERGYPYREWFLGEGAINLAETPPHGVFYNRISASSHTRGHRYAPEHAAAVLAWLESHGRRVVNNGRALQLELSKAAQYAALQRHGIQVPRTVVAVGRERVIQAAESFHPESVILKPNRGGKGHGVQLFATASALRDHVESAAYEPSLDGMMLLQEYIRPPQPAIFRIEFIGGKFFYAVRVDTSNGFELCPADVCAVEDAHNSAEEKPAPPFEIVEGFQHPLLSRYKAFLAENGIEIAGIEFILDERGEAYTYDVNCNTNYNPQAEDRAGRSGMGAIADYLGGELTRLQTPEIRRRKIAS